MYLARVYSSGGHSRFTATYWSGIPVRTLTKSWPSEGVFFFACAVMCFGFSACFHLLNHHSQMVNHKWLLLGLYGVFLMIVGTIFSGTFYGFYCERFWGEVYCSSIPTSVSPSTSTYAGSTPPGFTPQLTASFTAGFTPSLTPLLLAAPMNYPCRHHMPQAGLPVWFTIRETQHMQPADVGILYEYACKTADTAAFVRPDVASLLLPIVTRRFTH